MVLIGSGLLRVFQWVLLGFSKFFLEFFRVFLMFSYGF